MPIESYSREVYIGSAQHLQSRIVKHVDERKKKGYHLTHFAFMEFHPSVPMSLIKMIERILIKAGSLLLPNLSKGIHERNPVNTDMDCVLLNKAYY